MTTRRFRTAVVFTAAVCQWSVAAWAMAAGPPLDNEDRIAKLEKEVAELRSELIELRKTILNERIMNKIRGNWRQVSHVRNGKALVEPYEPYDVVWRMRAERASQCIHSPEPTLRIWGAMTLDATKDPVWVDFEKEDRGRVRVIQGILKMERKRVYIALHDHAARAPSADGTYNERPTSFRSTEDNGVSVFVLEPPVGRLLRVLQENSSGLDN